MKKLVSMLFVFIINLAFGLGYAVLISRLLGVESRGIVYSYQMPALVIATVIFSSLSLPVHRYFKDMGYSGIPLKQFLVLISLSIMLSLVVSILYVDIINNGLSVFLMSLVVVSQGINVLFIELSKFNVLSAKFFKSSLVTPILLFIITVVSYFIFGNFSTEIVIYSIVIAYSISSLISLFLLKNQFNVNGLFSLPNLSFYKDFFRYLIFKGISILSVYLDKLFIIGFYSKSVVGLVAVCMSLESVSSKFFSFLANFEMNNISKDNPDLKLRCNLHALTCCVAILGVFFTYFLGDFFIVFFFGEEYRAAQTYLIYIVATSVINGICWTVSQDWLLASFYKRIYTRQAIGVLAVGVGLVIVDIWNLSAEVLLQFVLLSSCLRLAFTVFYIDFSVYRGTKHA